MSLAQIRDEFRVPARIGQRVAYGFAPTTAPIGTITGSEDDWIHVHFDDGRDSYVHPWELIYLKDQP